MVDFRVQGAVDLDIRKFMAGALAVEKKLNELTKEIVELDAAINRVDGRKINIDTDVDNALEDFAYLENMIRAFDGRKIDIDVDVDRGLYDLARGASAAATSIGGRAAGAGGRASGHAGLIGAVALLATTLLPLTPLVGGVAGAMVSSMTVAAGAVGSFAVFAIPTFKKVVTGLEELKAAQQKLADAKDDDDVKEATKELALLLKQLDKDGLMPAIKALEKFKTTYESLTKTLQPRVLDVFVSGLDVAATVLEKIQPIAMNAALAIDRLLQMMERNLQGDDWGRFFAYLRDNAVSFIMTWGQVVGNFITGIANMIVAFDPLTQDFNDGILSMSERFLNWTRTLDENQSFQNFIKYVQTEGPKAWAGIKALWGILVDLGKALAPIGLQILQWIEQFAVWLQGIKQTNPELAKLVTQIAFLGAALLPILGFLKPLVGLFASLGGKIGLLLGVTAPVGAAILILAGALAWLGRKSEEAGRFFSRLGEIWELIKGAAQRVWEKIQPLIQTLQQEIAPKFYEALNNLLDIMEDLIPVAEFLIPIIGTILVEAIRAVVNIFVGLTETVKGVIKFFQGLIEFISGVFTGDWGKAWNGIKKMGQGIWEAIKGAFKVFINFGILKVARLGLGILKGVFKAAWGAIRGAASAAWSGIRGLLSAAWGRIRSAASSAWSAFVRVIRAAWVKAISAVRSGVSKVVGWVKGLPGKILGALGNLGSLLWNAGARILGGFLDGLKSKWGEVTGFIGGIASWISDHKGPKQRDQRLLQPHGNWIMEGLNEGMLQGFVKTMRTTEGIASSISDKMRLASSMSGDGRSFAGSYRDDRNSGPRFVDSHDGNVNVNFSLEVGPGGNVGVAELLNYLLRTGKLNIRAGAVKK